MNEENSRVGESGDIELGFAGLAVSVGDHIGHLYRRGEQMVQLLVGYYEAGLEDHDSCILFGRAETHGAVREGLEARGVNVEDHLDYGRLVFLDGESSAAKMQTRLSEVVEQLQSAGCRLIRHAGDMAWGLGKMPSTKELACWEAVYDLCFAPRIPIVALCHYDLNLFGGDVVLDVLRSHPLCIVDEAIHRNSFYMPPTDFLEEVNAREG